MSLTGQIIGFVTKRSAKRFERAAQDPLSTQTDKLMSMVCRNAETDFGRRYGFASIDSIAEFQKRVPITTYEDMKDDMQRVLSGHKGVFTAENPVMFAQTSGTTGDAKYIPVTPTCQGREHKDTTRTWLYHLRKDHPYVYDTKIVTLVSPAIEGYAPSGVPFGSTSGHIYKNMPGLVRRLYSIPYDVFEIEDYQAKYYAIMRISLEDNVGFLCTANPSSILKMCEKANEFGEDIIRDVRDGTLSKRYDIAPRIRESLRPRFRPNPRRAQALEHARGKRDGVLKPADYWPNLRLIACWKGGTVGHYIEKFQPWINPDGDRRIPVRDWGYLSSEARGSIPLSDEGSKGALTIGANFFEFVEVDD
ncbi:MAG: GH3 auxin-responsive promoter family protein, partial [Phycisphaerales bacterium]